VAVPQACHGPRWDAVSTETQTDNEQGQRTRNFLPEHGELPLSAFNFQVQQQNASPNIPLNLSQQNTVSNPHPLFPTPPITNIAMFQSVYGGISAHIPEYLKEKVLAGKIVDLSMLLKSSESNAFQGALIFLTDEGTLNVTL
jgi:hypothetical protein